MKRLRAAANGFMLATLVVSVLWIAFATLLGSPWAREGHNIILSFVSLYLSVLLLVVAFGFPIHWLFGYLRILQWWAYAGAPGVAVMLLFSVLSGVGNPDSAWSFIVEFTLPVAFICALGGFVFWLVSVRGNEPGVVAKP